MSEETFRSMCSNEPMREILAGLWKPKAGDEIIEGEGILFPSLYSPKRFTWLPRSDDLVERLSGYEIDINGPYEDDQNWTVCLTNKISMAIHCKSAELIKETLLLAFAWTQGLKWENGKWEKR